MKVTNVIMLCLAVVIISLAGFTAVTSADSNTTPDSQIGVVSVRYIFENSKKNDNYRTEAVAEQNQLIAELEKLNKEVAAANAGLKTLKPDSDDYLKSSQELLNKQAALEANREFYKRKMEIKDQRWTENLYIKTLEATKTVAAEKGLDIVFEKEEPEFPASSANELMLLIRTHKVVYSAGAVDISEEVLKVLDAQ
jgi:Skp family chaperone for outer membrane proteins